MENKYTETRRVLVVALRRVEQAEISGEFPDREFTVALLRSALMDLELAP